MALRLAVIGAALVVMGMAHLGGNGNWTAVGGAVLLGVGALVALVGHQRVGARKGRVLR